MTSNPEFKPGDVVWHVRHGKVTLTAAGNGMPDCFIRANGELVWTNGKYEPEKGARVLYTLAEAEQFGWYKPEPRVVEFESRVTWAEDVGGHGYGIIDSSRLETFNGKRVKVRVEEVE